MTKKNHHTETRNHSEKDSRIAKDLTKTLSEESDDNQSKENQPPPIQPETRNFSGHDNDDTPKVLQEYLLNIVTDEMVCGSIRSSMRDLGLGNIIKEQLIAHIKELVKKEVANILKDKNSKAHNEIQEILIKVNKGYFGNIQNLFTDNPVKREPPKLAVRPAPKPIEL